MRLSMAVAVLALLISAAPASASDYSGNVHGCDWSVTSDDSAHTWNGTTTCADGTLNATLDGHWTVDDNTGNATSVTLDKATLTAAVVQVDEPLDITLQSPIDTTSLQSLVQQAEEALALYAFQAASQYVTRQDFAKDAKGELDNLAAYCYPVAPASGPPSKFCKPPGPDFCDTPESCPPAGKAPWVADQAGGQDQAQGGAADDAEQHDLCPVLNKAEPNYEWICVPAYIRGDYKVQSGKTLVITPGAGLFMVPTGEGPNPTLATIKSDTRIVVIGGAIFGLDLRLEAPDIEIAGAAIDGLRTVDMKASTISIGHVDGDTVFKDIGSLPPLWAAFSGDIHKTIDIQARVGGGKIALTAPENFHVQKGSVIATTARGGPGADFDSGISPSGETELFGGSHGGVGGFPVADEGQNKLGVFYDVGGRKPAFDDPFAPNSPGDGGGGSNGFSAGLPGGGTIAVDASRGSSVIDGTLDASGYDIGVDGLLGDHGGAGAGGSIRVVAKLFAGRGVLNADGGSYCKACGNGFGGMGGGGRIAILSAKRSWTGSIHAHGGTDQQWPGLRPGELSQFRGTGGAGTVFERSVELGKDGKVVKGTGPYPDGTLTIDGGLAPGTYPPADSTPVADGWSSAKRRLVIAGEARVYAAKLKYARVDLARGALLTAAPGIKSLSLQAKELHVDRTSRIDMTGHGLAGGIGDGNGAAATAHGAKPASDGFGGSHGGAGGAPTGNPPNAKRGSTYDSAKAPKLPGGGGAGVPEQSTDGNPGGGVLFLNVGSLFLDGRLMADGRSGDGPTVTEPAFYDFAGGGGAGGTVVVKARIVSGHGTISARGGDTCRNDDLLPNADGCHVPTGLAGGGGGGRVALRAPSRRKWHGHFDVSGGVDGQAIPAERKKTKGSKGTVYVAAR